MLARAADPPPAAWTGAGLSLLAFLSVLPGHERAIRCQRRAADLVRINEEALLRIARDWAKLPDPPPVSVPVDTPLVRDLGLLGHASLFELLGTAHTPPGRNTLASWLLGSAPPAEIRSRQAAVAELAPQLDFRQQLEARTLSMARISPDVEAFLRWAESPPWLLAKPWLVLLARFLVLATAIALTLHLVEVQHFVTTAPRGTPISALLSALAPSGPLTLLLTVNIILSYLMSDKLARSFDRLEAREKEFQLYAEALELIPSQPFNEPLLQRIAGELTPHGRTAHRWMEILQSRMGLVDARHSGILHFFLQTLVLWDFHTLWLMERWQQEAGRHVRRWLTALGEVEALCALAGLKHDNPGWVFPRVEETEDRFSAKGLGHPLISEAKRVTNDVELGPPGTFLLVTGSNMSGKSTLLRSIGVNAVLAQAGGPVCAEELSMPPVDLATSILVEDSLEDGVSFFLAELHRIRSVVDAADRAHEAGRTVLYLLDEVLRGTNSQERQVAVRRVILHLLRQGAIGAVSTHDLQIAEIPELAESVRPVHFRETLHPGGDPPMTFDYVMRPGVATTTNALRLMELVGLKAEEGT
ncbi:MAG TPA: DNA mismatch repair protein MutS [Thermoanaerobaculia bacterium]|nr:DNA mismatch repair protein MutS [Thermoanaerobaculia bacterium]